MKRLIAILAALQLACVLTLPVSPSPSPRHTSSLRDYHALYDNRPVMRPAEVHKTKANYR